MQLKENWKLLPILGEFGETGIPSQSKNFKEIGSLSVKFAKIKFFSMKIWWNVFLEFYFYVIFE